MSYLFFDTETTGLPDFRMPHEWDGQPHICQLASILTDEEGRVKSELNVLIRPDGWTIPKSASDIHGITQSDAEKYGISIRGALSLFHRFIASSDLIVAHNTKFDCFILECEEIRQNYKPLKLNTFCTMDNARDIVKCPPTERMIAKGMDGYKSPSLQEAHIHFFGVPFDGAHDAMADVRACKDVFFELKKLRG